MLKVAERVDPQRASDVATKLRPVFEGKVKAAFLFGGRAKGYELKGDYDVAVYFGRGFDLYEAGALAADVAAALGVSEELVDLVVLDSAPPELVLEALDGLPVYVEDSLAVFELRFRSLREAIDIEACRL